VKNVDFKFGLVGAILFALGGAYLLYYFTNTEGQYSITRVLPIVGVGVVAFICLMFIGIGLWLIVQSGKPDRE